jgi:hypothetical protein
MLIIIPLNYITIDQYSNVIRDILYAFLKVPANPVPLKSAKSAKSPVPFPTTLSPSPTPTAEGLPKL